MASGQVCNQKTPGLVHKRQCCFLPTPSWITWSLSGNGVPCQEDTHDPRERPAWRGTEASCPREGAILEVGPSTLIEPSDETAAPAEILSATL